MNLLSVFIPLFVDNLPSSTRGLKAGVEETTEINLSLLDLLLKGGWVMVPIALLLISAIYLFLERYFSIQRLARVDQTLLSNTINSLSQGNIQSARTLVASHPSLLARILERGLLRLGSPITEIETGMEQQARSSISHMEKNLGLLAAISTLAPMFGFLGTVMGMITVFTQIAFSNDQLSISKIADGMYVKMVTSAAGLVVGIFAHMCYVTIHTLIDRSIIKLETAAGQFIDYLYRPQ
jgi:biopolymer transport protein ExbB